jgi:uncharacterized protein (DUF2249 family)
MSKVEGIEAAIRALPETERERFVSDLPALLRELHGDGEWERIINDAHPRPALSKLGDEIQAEFKANPERFPTLDPEDFDRHPRRVAGIEP